VSTTSAIAQEPNRPKLGVTFSGGGAKGLAHVAYVQAMEEAGLRPDYVTGTSMGAIVGALWAAGYSGEEMEELVTSINWNTVFNQRPPLTKIPILQKDHSGTFPLALSADSNGIDVPSALFEAQEVWFILSDYFFHTHQIRSFDELEIPFACVATDLFTGEAHIMLEGDLVSAVRASMAIPSVFSPVKRDGKVLVDGGSVMNFPVQLAKDLGADYVIGLSVSDPQENLDEDMTLLDIMLQLGTVQNTVDYENEKELTDLFINNEIEGFEIADFSEAKEIIRLSKIEAEKWVKRFREIADSLNIHEEKPLIPVRKDEIYITSIQINGLDARQQAQFLRYSELKAGRVYRKNELITSLRDMYYTQNYKYIRHSFSESEGSGYVLNLNMEPFSDTSLGLGFNYQSFTDISLLTQYSRLDLLFNHTNLEFQAAWSRNPRFRLNYDWGVGVDRRNTLRLYGQHSRFDFPVYQAFDEINRFRNLNWEAGLQYWWNFSSTSALGLGNAWYLQQFKPEIGVDNRVEASSRGNIGRAEIRINSLNRNAFPEKGKRIHLLHETYYNQTISTGIFEYATNGLILDPAEPLPEPPEFFHSMRLSAEGYANRGRFTTMLHLQAGQQFNTDAGLFNYFRVGGDVRVIDHQILFTGLQEHTVNSTSIAAATYGLQYRLGSSFYAQLKGSLGFTDIYVDEVFNLDRRISGLSATLGNLSVIGPASVSLFVNTETGAVNSYLNIGFNF
jgi:NTE family protein